MSFRTKLVFLLFLVAVVPVAVPGGMFFYTSREEMSRRIEGFHGKSAALVANSLDSFLLDAIQEMKLAAQFIPFDRIPPDELHDVLKLPYRQFAHVNIVALLDANGQQLARPVYATSREELGAAGDHEIIPAGGIEAFGHHVPLNAALKTGVAFGPVYVPEGGRSPRVAMAVAFPVQRPAERWVLAVELSLRELADTVRRSTPAGGGIAYVVDGEGRLVHHPELDRVARRDSVSTRPIVAAGMRSNEPATLRFAPSDGPDMLGAFAPVRTLGWGLVLEQPQDVAYRTIRRLQTYALFWLGLALVVSLLGGLVFARTVSNPVRELTAGVREISAGRFDQTIQVRSRDEIGLLADGFNAMTGSLRESFETISRQKEEIEVWNRELQQRVEERTRELREAHQQILQSQKLAAVGELGAGVAHEINNPLASILGFAELMLGKAAPDDDRRAYLEHMVEQAKRIKAIVSDLLEFSQFQPEGNRKACDVNELIRSALRMVQERLGENNIEVQEHLSGGLPAVLANPAALQQVFVHIIDNAINAMSEGGSLQVDTSGVESGAVKAVVSDTGRGIPHKHLARIFEPFFTTKVQWSGRGLGLSVAHRIVQEHKGKITVESEEGRGTSFTIILAAAPPRTQLA